MKLGVTATQGGLTSQQITRFVAELFRNDFPEEFHHGGCVGGDDQLQFYVYKLRPDDACKLIMHRGSTPSKWAGCDELQDVILAEKDNIERNHDIVDETTELWSFPGEMKEVLRSGTWATIRYAKKQGKPVLIVYPDGSWEWHNKEGS